jgi:crotonobetainyl-CoA:carnitine CoA-transferase CaiB-like acyl-CoA transferase
LARAFSDRFGTETASHWVQALRSADLAAIPVASLDDATTYLFSRGAVYFEEGLDGVRVPRPGIGAWLSETPPKAGANPGPIGSQVVEVLEDLGLDSEAMESLADLGVICMPDGLPQVDLFSP